jgi:LacI family transcriptional regulator
LHYFTTEVHNIVMLLRTKPTAQANILILMEWYDHHIREGLGRFAVEHNWHLTIDERASIPKGWQGDGVLTVFNKRQDIAEYLSHLRIPIVDMGLYHPEIPLPRVTGDCLSIGSLAAEHFAERGYQHVAWFSRVTSPIERMRYEGFKSGCLKHGLQSPLDWVWEKQASSKVDSWKELSIWLRKILMRAPTPLAVSTYNDYDASNVLYVCLNAGIHVPEQVAILGVDDNELICLNQPVPLSSIMHDLQRVGYEGASLLAKLIQGIPPPAHPILIPPKGVHLRQSTDYTAIDVPSIRKAIAFIKNNIHKSFGINEVASHAGVSRSTLDRLFLENFNRTVYAEAHRTRISTVKTLLTTTALTIHKIAEQSGFCHAQHLNNLFKSSEGLTPKNYRKRYK